MLPSPDRPRRPADPRSPLAAFHRLRREPFDASPDPHAPALTGRAEEAFRALQAGLRRGDAALLLTGAPGLGKTTLARALAASAQGDGVRPVFVHHPRLSFADLLATLGEGLGLRGAPPAPAFQRLQAVQAALVARLGEGGRTLLVVDEAQALPDDTLESLRLLATLEAGALARPLQILLVGQPELARRLARRRWRAMDQRIGVRVRLSRLGRSEARAYLRARLVQAGAAVPGEVFSPLAVEALTATGGGAPRRIDRIARGALALAADRAERPVRATTVRRAARRVEPARSALGLRAGAAVLAAAAVLAGAAGLAAWRDGGPGRPAAVETAHAAPSPVAPAAFAPAPQPALRAAMALSAPPAPPLEPAPVPPADLRPAIR